MQAPPKSELVRKHVHRHTRDHMRELCACAQAGGAAEGAAAPPPLQPGGGHRGWLPGAGEGGHHHLCGAQQCPGGGGLPGRRAPHERRGEMRPSASRAPAALKRVVGLAVAAAPGALPLKQKVCSDCVAWVVLD